MWQLLNMRRHQRPGSPGQHRAAAAAAAAAQHAAAEAARESGRLVPEEVREVDSALRLLPRRPASPTRASSSPLRVSSPPRPASPQHVPRASSPLRPPSPRLATRSSSPSHSVSFTADRLREEARADAPNLSEKFAALLIRARHGGCVGPSTEIERRRSRSPLKSPPRSPGRGLVDTQDPKCGQPAFMPLPRPPPTGASIGGTSLGISGSGRGALGASSPSSSARWGPSSALTSPGGSPRSVRSGLPTTSWCCLPRQCRCREPSKN